VYVWEVKTVRQYCLNLKHVHRQLLMVHSYGIVNTKTYNKSASVGQVLCVLVPVHGKNSINLDKCLCLLMQQIERVPEGKRTWTLLITGMDSIYAKMQFMS
jgi:hypothetical protein